MADAYSFGVVLEVVNGMMIVDFHWPEALLIKKGAAEETVVAGDCVRLLGKEFITKEERTLNSVIIILVAFRDGKLTMLLQPPGRAIQVETGFGERLPSIDTRPPRTRDTDAIIEIVLQDPIEDSANYNSASEQPEKDMQGEELKGVHDTEGLFWQTNFKSARCLD